MKKILVIISMIAMFLFGACSATNASAEQNNPIKIWMQNTNAAYHTLKVVDDDTGVNYIVVSTERGNGGYSVAITPRLNADGTLYVSK